MASRLDLDCVVKNLLDVTPAQLVNESDLIGIHKTRVAHHIASVRQIDCQNRATAILDRACPVVMELFGVVRPLVPTWELILKVGKHLWISRHNVFKAPMLRTLLYHPDLAVALDNFSLDFTDLFVFENFDRQFTFEYLGADLRDTLRA